MGWECGFEAGCGDALDLARLVSGDAPVVEFDSFSGSLFPA